MMTMSDSAATPPPVRSRISTLEERRAWLMSPRRPQPGTAVAAGSLRTTAKAVQLISTVGLAKGDALATARSPAFGRQAHQRAIPLCHQLPLTGVEVEFTIGDTGVDITATVRSTDRTGVEMEALTAVSVAALTLYDMVKAVDRRRGSTTSGAAQGQRSHGTWTGDDGPIRAGDHRLDPRGGRSIRRPCGPRSRHGLKAWFSSVQLALVAVSEPR